jgi:hypothetical protein
MTSSSTDARTEPRTAFLSADRGSIVRLAVVLAIGAAALVGPRVGSTSAQFTDRQEVGVTFSVPAATPSPTP